MSDSRETAKALASEIEKTFTERGSTYGSPEVNFTNIAAFWNAWIHSRYPDTTVLLDAFDVAQMSSLIKKARLANSPGHRDSSLDDAVYALLGAGIGDELTNGSKWSKDTEGWRAECQAKTEAAIKAADKPSFNTCPAGPGCLLCNPTLDIYTVDGFFSVIGESQRQYHFWDIRDVTGTDVLTEGSIEHCLAFAKRFKASYPDKACVIAPITLRAGEKPN